MQRISWAYALGGVMLGGGIVGIAACSSSESAMGGRHVASPQVGIDAGDAGGGVDAADAGRHTDAGGRSPFGEMIMPSHIIDPPSNIVEREWGLTLSPDEKHMVNTCPRRAWSKNVPDRDCKKDNECGDGICDRGHCSAIITCLMYPGAPCKTDAHCRGLCMEGRCRSCVSDEECQKKEMNPYGACDAPGSHPPGRSCAYGGPPPPPEELKAMCDAAPPDKKPPYCKGP
jgi:hypothetical protein